jgi:hypothetical protein
MKKWIISRYQEGSTKVSLGLLAYMGIQMMENPPHDWQGWLKYALVIIGALGGAATPTTSLATLMEQETDEHE